MSNEEVEEVEEEDGDKIDRIVGKLTDEEIQKQLTIGNTTSIYEANLRSLNKSRTMYRLAKESDTIKKSMTRDAHEILKVYQLIFKGFADERWILHKGVRSDESYTVLGTCSTGVGYEVIYKNISSTITVGSDAKNVNGLRLSSINGSIQLLQFLRIIDKDYDTVKNIIKTNFTDMKFKRFERFFAKAVNNVDFLNMPDGWGKFVHKLDNPISYEVVENGKIHNPKVKTISFGDDDSFTSDQVSINNGGYSGYYRSGNGFKFNDLQRLEPIFVEVHRAMVEYINVLQQRASIISALKDEIVKEFDKELMYEAAFKDGKKDD